MAKKKLSLKPVARGFATTSALSKKPIPVEVIPEPEPKPLASETAENGPSVAVDASRGGKDSWENEVSLEDASLQGYIERLQERGDREVARIIKGMEFDKRLGKSFLPLALNEQIRDRVLKLAMEGEADSLASIPASADKDKAMLKFYTINRVLRALGFTEERAAECLKALDGQASWEDALEWMWLHCEEDEILLRGDWKPVLKETEQPQSLQSMIAVLAPESDTAPTSEPAVVPDTNPETAEDSPAPVEPTSFFTSGAESGSEDEDVTPSQSWADLMISLDAAKLAAQKTTPGGKKKIKGGVETPETRALKEKIAAIEGLYVFNKKEAEIQYRALKSKAQAEALAARLRGVSVASTSVTTSTAASIKPSTAPTSPALVATRSAHEDDDDEGDMFGGMLDEPVVVAASTREAESSSNTLIAVRPMPIPKSFTNLGSIPKAVLKSTVQKLAKYAVVTYACLSGHSRAARAGLEIRWSLDRRQVWAMTDIACESMLEAENYVSTLALHTLVVKGISQVNWRVLPAVFRELWEELDTDAKNVMDAASRSVWRRVQGVVDEKVAVEAQADATHSIKPLDAVAEDSQTDNSRKIIVSEFLRQEFKTRQASKAYQEMLKQRSTLPIASFREQIVASLETSQILVLSGETGCGKSTQLPSFILEDQLSKGQPCKIYVTEPRRISAISLAQRVSRELGDGPNAVGTPASLVGYSIRLESLISKNTRLAFVTNGIALRMLESGSGVAGKSTAFDDITHIIVDEVHERSIESDFLLIVLKTLMKQRKDLKVVLMSATVDADKISDFFGGCPTLSVPGRTFPVDVNYLEDAVQYTGWHINDKSPYAIHRRKRGNGKQMEWEEADGDDDDDDDLQPSDPLKLSSNRYSPDTVDTINLLDPKHIPYDLILRLLERLCFEDEASRAYSQAILIFLPGLAEIRRVNDMLQEHPRFGGQEFRVYPLHSSVSSEGQSAVFELPPPGVRKIVISTNIAETGVTIPDITCVIDSGKHREMRYDEKRQLSRLVECYIARSNAKQRRGRAGRVQDGLAFHLFTRARHDLQMVEHPSPEMLRLSLQDLALRIKILKINIGTSIEDVLLRALDPPAVINIQRAVAALVEVKALTFTEEITPMGRLLSKLPMDVHLGKFLLIAALFRCLNPALTIAATLNGKSPFVASFGQEHQADLAKATFKTGNSDFLTLHNVFSSWRKASENPNFIRTYCKRNYLSHQNLQQVEELRQQLLSYLIDSSFLPVSDLLRKDLNQARYSRGFRTRFVNIPAELDVNAESVPILSSALAAGLYPKLLVIDSATGGMKTIANGQAASIHPSSVNFRTPKNEYGTNHLVYFTLMQSKKLYAWEVGPVDDKALVLLCGDIADFRLSASSLQIDRRLKFTIEPKSALALKQLRNNFNAAISTMMRGRSLNDVQRQWFELGVECLETGLFNDKTQSVGIVSRK